MKLSKKFLAGVAVCLAALSSLAFDVPTQNMQTTYKSDTNSFSLTLTNTAGVTLSGLKYRVLQDHGLSLFATVVSTNAASVSVPLGFDVTYDTTNGSTTQPITWTLPSNFVGTNTYWTNMGAAVFNNVSTIQCTRATNSAVGTGATNTVRITSLTYSQANK